jgi:hypothetical protein
MMRPILLLSVVLLSALLPSDIGASPDIRKVTCLNSIQGCPCVRADDVFTVFHAESALVLGPGKPGYVSINVRKTRCEYPEALLVRMPPATVLHSRFQNVSHAPLSLDKMTDVEKLKRARRIAMGNFYPTFYHLALEDLYPGNPVRILTASGNSIGFASDEFLKQVSWEGSGITRDGRGLSYAGPGRYSEYNASKAWAYGSGGRVQVLPYRSIAVNFPGICRALGQHWKGCTPGAVPGLMVYIPAIAQKEMKIEGIVHDGYFCAADTGAPYYIRYNRIDMFVGTHGGGNPFLPEERQGNEFLRNGLQALLPSDWRLWTSVDSRVFCDLQTLPRDIFNPSPGSCTHDYHVVARDKALAIEALLDERGEPVRCFANPRHNGPGFPR